jgi:hypothetical protein
VAAEVVGGAALGVQAAVEDRGVRGGGDVGELRCSAMGLRVDFQSNR